MSDCECCFEQRNIPFLMALTEVENKNKLMLGKLSQKESKK